jgi:hypothetical protein
MASPLQRRVFVGAATALLLQGCGYVGDPLPPALYIPLPVTDLRAMQEGDVLSIGFTLPARTTEDLPVDEVPEIDLRAAVWETRPWDETAWEREATRLSTLPPENGGVAARSSAEPWADKRVLLRVRVAGKLGRFSSWSEPVALRVLGRPADLRELKVAATAEGVGVSWTVPPQQVPGMKTEISRSTGEKGEFATLATVAESTWVDRDAQFGESYSYRVRQRLEGDEQNYAGPLLGPVRITPVDTFAPAIPADVSAVAGATAVELSWTRNFEADFREYRVYRSIAGAEFLRVGEPTSTATFSDTTAPRSTPLRYRITAVDAAGNESAPCEPIEIILP